MKLYVSREVDQTLKLVTIIQDKILPSPHTEFILEAENDSEVVELGKFVERMLKEGFECYEMNFAAMKMELIEGKPYLVKRRGTIFSSGVQDDLTLEGYIRRFYTNINNRSKIETV